jgi:hypothetical protein
LSRVQFWADHPHPDPLPQTAAAARGSAPRQRERGKLLAPVGGGEDSGEGASALPKGLNGTRLTPTTSDDNHDRQIR